MKKLTQQEATKLLPLIVDNEASEDDKVAFFRYIQEDEKMKKKYESLLLVKQLIKTKYTPEKAPDHLKKKVSEMIKDMEWEEEEKSKVDTNILSDDKKTVGNIDRANQHEKPSPLFNFMNPARYLVAAAVIFILSLLTLELLEKASTNNFQTGYNIEELALSYFNSGTHISASLDSYQPKSSDHAATILENEMSHHLRLPLIEGASLRRVMKTTFADGYVIPVLEFYQESIDETVHVFAFQLDSLKEWKKIKRDPEAVKLCKSYKDYHVKNIDGKHVVSWKWGDYWYTAVSNHSGDDLIALVEPQEPNGENSNEDGEW